MNQPDKPVNICLMEKLLMINAQAWNALGKNVNIIVELPKEELSEAVKVLAGFLQTDADGNYVGLGLKFKEK